MEPLVPEERNADRRRRAILIVEDDFLRRWSAAEYLRETGFDVIEAVSEGEALAAIRTGSEIDAIFCAIDSISTTAGHEFFRCLEEQRPTLPVLLAGEGLDNKGNTLATPTHHASIGKPYVMRDVEQRLLAFFTTDQGCC